MQLQPLVISRTPVLPYPRTSDSNDINRPNKRRCPIDPSCRPLKHLDAYDVVEVYGQVHRIVARLRVADVDAIEQQDDLLLGAAPDGDVRLCPGGTSLPDIDAHGVLQ